MQITDVRVKKINSQNRMKAIASITIDEVFVIHDIKVIESDKGLFIAMPSKKNSKRRIQRYCSSNKHWNKRDDTKRYYWKI